jgi:hypothetical protein
MLLHEPAGLRGLQFAVDAELADQAVPPALARRRETADPAAVWPVWTATEVVAKLTDTPVLAWLSTGEPVRATPLRVGDLEVAWRTETIDDLLVTYGVSRRQSGAG